MKKLSAVLLFLCLPLLGKAISVSPEEATCMKAWLVKERLKSCAPQPKGIASKAEYVAAGLQLLGEDTQAIRDIIDQLGEDPHDQGLHTLINIKYEQLMEKLDGAIDECNFNDLFLLGGPQAQTNAIKEAFGVF